MGVSVGNAVEYWVVFKQQFEAAYINTHRNHDKKKPDGEGESAPGQGDGGAEAAFDGP